MRIAVFSTKPYDQRFLEAANQRLADQSGPAAAHEIMFYETRLSAESVARLRDSRRLHLRER